MKTITQIEMFMTLFKKKSYFVIFLIIMVCLFLLSIKYYISHQQNEGFKTRKLSTQSYINNKIVDTLKVSQNVHTLYFNDNSIFTFLIWSSKRELLAELFNKGDKVFKDSNSNEIIVKRGKVRFTYYLRADTNNIEWKKKNLPNNHYYDIVDTLDE
ncbi:MAG: hypothetical protein NTW25_06700 [Candidatus Kapabacteria bacterium]|nr:hypothetical protein [Candidatus Kapabacteria bacterium]